jgi:Mitochondrial import 2
MSDDEIASLPSEPTSHSDLDDDLTLYDDEYSDAEEQWKESIQQLELLLTMVVVPFMGKYLGRKCAYWGMSPRLMQGAMVN